MSNPTTSTPPDSIEGRSPFTPGAGTLAVLALAWLLAMLSSARLIIGNAPVDSPQTVNRALETLPQVISASLIAGVAVGLAAVSLLARLRPAAARRGLFRYATGAGAGVLTGLAVATPILREYDGLPSILVLAGAVATVATLGGLLGGVGNGRTVVAAGAGGALGTFVVGLAERAFEGDLRDLFGAGESAASVVAATGWAVLTAALVAGTVAGVLGYLYLRRCGPASLRWPAYLLAGAMPGLLVLLAEGVTRIGGARLLQMVSAVSQDDEVVVNYVNAARLNRALIVVFVGALVAIFLLGRTLRPAHDAAPADTDPTAEDTEDADPPAGADADADLPAEADADLAAADVEAELPAPRELPEESASQASS